MIKYMEDGNHVSDYQRLTKPLIEKRRRARINLSLTQLKEMVIDSGKHTIEKPKCKYEKADILELTVQYLHDIHQSQQIEKIRSAQSFSDGFSECVKQVEQFLKYLPLTNNNGETNAISDKLLLHLDSVLRTAKSNKLQNTIINYNKNNNNNDNNIENHNSNSNGVPDLSSSSETMDMEAAIPHQFRVIHHTSEYSESLPSCSSTPPSLLSSPRMSSPVMRSPVMMSSSPSQTVPSSSPFSSEIDVRPIDLVLYGNERNGQCFQMMDMDGVWRPW